MPPKLPGEAVIIAANLFLKTSPSANFSLFREAQSKIFFIPPGTEALYSGVAINKP